MKKVLLTKITINVNKKNGKGITVKCKILFHEGQSF
jgi:hypothetical protein